MVGWLSIAGTPLNYPVMQPTNEPNYSLKRNFEKQYSDLGTPYIQENCNLTGSDNLVIYGHHIKGGKMCIRDRIRAVGMILLGFGVVQIGLSLKSHDPSQRANGFLTLAGGVVITFAKEILTLITG